MSPGEPPCRQLREEIKRLSFPRNDNVSLARRFFPRSKLQESLSYQKIAAVLECPRSVCTSRVESNTRTDTDTLRAVQTIIGPENTDQRQALSFLCTFALLVYIECPQLIYAFLDRSFNDENLETTGQKLRAAFLRESIWPTFNQVDREQSKTLSEEFLGHRYKFVIPCIKDDGLSTYDEETILPFYDDRPLGRITDRGEVVQEGAYGVVHSFEILPEYDHLPTTSKPTRLARKQLRGSDVGLFEQELKNLELIKRLDDPHLVRVLKAYKHGDSVNLIFPCAKTNLGQYLRDPRYGASDLVTERLEQSPLWQQVLGIIRALDRMINCILPKKHGCRERFYGCHSDPKPANILVEYSGNWVISDFGQARFKPANESSRMIGVGGNEAYAPPEIDQPNMQLNRQYDVWLLGCILLEVATFLVKGHRGLDALDAIRKVGIEESHHLDDRFFCRTFNQREYEIKPRIRAWMRDLPNHLTNQRSKDFLQSTLDLVRQMMSVNLAQRLTSNLVYYLFSGLLQGQAYSRAAASIPVAMHALPPNEVDLGKDIVPHIKTVLCNMDRSWIHGPLRLIENSEHEVQFVALESSDNLRWRLGTRARSRLVPSFSMRDSSHHVGYYQNSFQIEDDGATGPPRFARFYFTSWNDMISMQSVLLGQNIRKTILLDQVSFERRLPLRANLMHSSKTRAKAFDLGSAVAVQLCSEKSYRDPDSWRFLQRKDSPRTARDYFFSGASPRRLLVYFQYAILTVRMAKNARAEKPVAGIFGDSFRIIPTDKTRDPSFTVNILPHDSDPGQPSLPLERIRLDELEGQGAIECKSMTLKFHNVEDCISFWKSYKNLKEEWSAEEKKLEECRKSKSIGEVIGWAPR